MNIDAWWRVKPRQHYWIAYCNDHKPEPGHVNSDMVWMLGERGDRLAEALQKLVDDNTKRGLTSGALSRARRALERDR